MTSATVVTQEPAQKTAPKAGEARRRPATDDEILGLQVTVEPEAKGEEAAFRWDNEADQSGMKGSKNLESHTARPSDIAALLEANPELRMAWDDAAAYRKAFATPDEANVASTRLADLDRMDSLFFSHRPEDHAELAQAVAALDPASFNSLAAAMAQLAASKHQETAGNVVKSGQQGKVEGAASSGDQPKGQASVQATAHAGEPSASREPKIDQPNRYDALTPAQAQFFHSANAAAVEDVLRAIETQVERLLPEEISRSARNRVIGEIYRELDTTLRSNRQLAQQTREAFRAGALDGEHRRALVSLVAGRARQALPAVAKRVLNEWTSTIVAASQDRRARQKAAEGRVDIAGSGRTGGDGRRATSPRDIDYSRMSDSDILNL